MDMWSSIFVLLSFFVIIHCKSKCPVDCGVKNNADFVEKFCGEHDGTMVERCCMANGTKDFIIGLDLSGCNLTEFDVKNVWRPGVHIIDLHENELKNISKKDFIGFTNLTYLYLPPEWDCPGGADAWNVTYTYLGKPNECQVELNPCDYLNVSCTINGMCVHKGPGMAKCLCLPGHHGYKCLQQGEFPTTPLVLGLCIPTVLLSFLSWFYLRRNVIVPEKVD